MSSSNRLCYLPHLKQHRLLTWYDLSGAVIVEVDDLLQEQAMAIELVGCIYLCQDIPADSKADGLQLPDLQIRTSRYSGHLLIHIAVLPPAASQCCFLIYCSVAS